MVFVLWGGCWVVCMHATTELSHVVDAYKYNCLNVQLLDVSDNVETTPSAKPRSDAYNNRLG